MAPGALENRKESKNQQNRTAESGTWEGLDRPDPMKSLSGLAKSVSER